MGGNRSRSKWNEAVRCVDVGVREGFRLIK